MNRWIRYTEELPPIGQTVLLATVGGEVGILVVREMYVLLVGAYLNDPASTVRDRYARLYWQALPAPPTGDGPIETIEPPY